MQVWIRARAGDLQAVAVILERLEPRVERIGAHYARRTGMERRELVQEGILAILEGVAELAEGISDPEAYLVRLARWRLMDGWKWREVAQHMGCSSANLGYHVRQIRTRYQQYR